MTDKKKESKWYNRLGVQAVLGLCLMSVFVLATTTINDNIMTIDQITSNAGNLLVGTGLTFQAGSDLLNVDEYNGTSVNVGSTNTVEIYNEAAPSVEVLDHLNLQGLYDIWNVINVNSSYGYFAEDLDVNGNITANEIRAFIGGHEIGTVIIDAQNVYTNITNTTAKKLNGFTFFNGTLTPQVDGAYKITSQFSYRDGANTEFHLSLKVNNVVDNELYCHNERKLGTGGDVGSASYVCEIDLNAGDEIIPVVENSDNTNDAIIDDIQFWIGRVGD